MEKDLQKIFQTTSPVIFLFLPDFKLLSQQLEVTVK
jgi:2-hydroxychromene-2-carboxylate isomerase